MSFSPSSFQGGAFAGGAFKGGAFGASLGPTAPPANITAPVISGADTNIGTVLSCTTGVWSQSPTSYAYQWYVDATPVSGETASTYTILLADVGLNIYCEVTATNALGSSSPEASNTLVAANLSVPSNTVAPFLDSTTAATGDTITCSPGTWAGNPPPSYTYEWFGNTTSTTNTYENDGNEETGVYCEVTATNSQGSGGPEASDTCDFSAPGGGIYYAGDTSVFAGDTTTFAGQTNL